jgi:hypothetical protein
MKVKRMTIFKKELVWLLLLFSARTQAQLWILPGGDSAYASKVEVGIAMYTSDVREFALYSTDPIPYQGNYFVNGVYFRFIRNKTPIRFLVNHYVDDDGLGQYYADASLPVFFEGSAPRPSYSGMTRNALEFKGGAQLLLFSSRLSPYLTADLGYRYTVEKSYLTYQTTQSGTVRSVTSLFKSESSQFGFYGGLGMKYQLNSRMVIGFETQISLIYERISSEIPGLKRAEGYKRGLQPGQFTFGFYL